MKKRRRRKSDVTAPETDESLQEIPAAEEQEQAEVEESAEKIEQEKQQETETEKKEKRRRRRHGRKNRLKITWGKKQWIITGSILAAIIVIYLGISAFFINHFYFGTQINGQNFSAKTADDVKDYIKQQVSGYELTIRERNNETDTIRGSEIELTYKENDDIEKALKAQHPLLWITAFFSNSSADVTVEVGYSEEKLNEKIQSLKAVTREQTEPSSAYPKFNGTVFEIQPEVSGNAVDTEVFHEKITQYITEFRSELNMNDEGCYKKPQYTKNSEEVKAACDTMNRYCKASITYKMDEDVVVDATLISEWLTCDENMNVSLNYDSVRAWMREFGKKYDTVGTTRTITTPTGKTVQVSGGTYGWSVNEDEETQTLITSIENVEIVEKEPAYKQTAASRGAQDWGNTYLEVDLSTQHMWYIVDGAVALETDIVTGKPSTGNSTPTGVYSVVEKKRDKTLVGKIDPSTGKPEYETPVSYWMRITWTGIGFHDASWQSAFGGSRYLTNGSHGCINMPVSKAASLYEMLAMGTPAIVHN